MLGVLRPLNPVRGRELLKHGETPLPNPPPQGRRERVRNTPTSLASRFAHIGMQSEHSTPQIDFDDTRIGAHLIQRAFRQHRALVQARDPDPKLAHEMHVVLDHDHRMIARDFA